MATTAAILDVLVRANNSQAIRALNQTDTRLKGVDKSAGTAMRNVGKHAKYAGLALSAGLGLAAKQGFDELAEGQKVAGQTAAVLKSTGGAAGVTAKHIEKLAGAISRKTGIDDEQIQASQNLLLTFTNVRNEVGKGNKIFDRATKTVTDMSVALGQSGKTSAIQLGKALNDPIKGVTALRRVGVDFTESQKEQIKRLVESGKTMQAQKVILGELNREFGGSAKAAGETFPGQLNKLRNAFEEVAGGLVASLLPVLQTLADRFAAVGQFLQEHPKTAKILGIALVGLAGGLLAVSAATKVWSAATRVAAAVQWLLNAALAANPIGLVVVALAALAAGIVLAYKKSETFRKIVGAVWTWLKTAASNVLGWLKDHWPLLLAILAGPFGLAVAVIAKHWDKVKSGLKSAWDWIKTTAGDAWTGIKSAILTPMGAVIDWFTNRYDDFKKLAHNMAKPFVNAFDKIAGAVKKVLDFLDDIIDRVESVIDWIGKIKLPHIDIPLLGGGAGKGNGTTVGPIGNLSNVQDIADLSLKYGLSGGRGVDQAYRPGDDGWHGQNRARDLSGPAGIMLAFAKALASSQIAGKLLELIHTPLGFGIKNGQYVPNSFWGAEVLADHYDHVHVAMQRGGKVPGIGAGDKVPALLEPGEFVIRKQIVDKFGPTLFTNLNRMKDGGIVQAAKAAQAAGFRGNNLLTAIAIAGPESGFRNSARLRTSAEDSRGMTQINTYAHPWARKLNLYNAFVNYRAARRVWREAGGSFSPWSGFTSGGYRAYMDDARRAVESLKKKGGGGKGKGKHGGGLGVKFGPLIPNPPPPPPAGTLEPGPGGGGGGGSGPDPNIERVADLLSSIDANQKRLIYLSETQGPQIVGAVVAAVNGSIGGQVGLALQGVRSRVGGVAGY